MSFWQDRKVLITGGASFIGSHLTDALVERGAKVRIVDDLTSGKLENIQRHLANSTVEFIHADLREPGIARVAMQGIEYVFHLAADHGGRGYVDLHQAGPATNLFLGGLVFWEARRAGVGKVVFASSGCVYPNFLQSDPDKEVYLTEDLVKPPYDADNMYGWAKLMNELTLKAYYQEYRMKAASCRYFTVYGPRGVENHAVIAMIAKAFIGQDPFERRDLLVRPGGEPDAGAGGSASASRATLDRPWARRKKPSPLMPSRVRDTSNLEGLRARRRAATKPRMRSRQAHTTGRS